LHQKPTDEYLQIPAFFNIKRTVFYMQRYISTELVPGLFTGYFNANMNYSGHLIFLLRTAS